MYQSQTSAIAEWYYDFIDVNSNITRAEMIARTIGNGLHAAINFAVMVVLLLFAIALAWQFDFHSTYGALEGLITQIVKGLPVWLVPRESNGNVAVAGATIVSVITMIITVAPTLTEIFTSNLARANIAVIKIFVLGFSAFDVITDIPTTKAWIATWQPSIDALGIFAWPVYWIAFFGWLLMATVGFQLAVVIFAYLTVIYFKKMTVGGQVVSTPYRPGNPNNKQPKTQPTIITPKGDGKPTVVEVAGD